MTVRKAKVCLNCYEQDPHVSSEAESLFELQ
jgi:hypothetical protein